MKKEVIYLNEADRPKKQEPLSFTEWYKRNDKYIVQIGALSIARLNDAANEYADYRNSFNADVKEVEFTHLLSKNVGYVKDNGGMIVSNAGSITYLGKCITDGDMFSVKYKAGGIQIFKGNLNSGFYSTTE